MAFIKRIVARLSYSLVVAAHHARRFALRMQGEAGVRTVRVLLLRNGRVLLVRHWYAPGVLMLPGGGIRKGETAEDAARREISEETGFEMKKLDLLGTYEGNLPGDSVTVFFAEEFDGYVRLVPSPEIMMRSFRGIADIETLEDIAPDSMRRIEAYRQGVRGETGRW